MRVIVTGGAGFIGSHVVDKLVKMDYDVVIIDNLSSGFEENINPSAKFNNINISDKKLKEIFEMFKPDCVMHLAAQSDVNTSISNPILDCRTNIEGTINILECCRKYNVKKIIYSSSAAVYGDPKYLPVDEKHLIIPKSNYGISKYVSEMYIKVFSELYGLNFTIFRYSNVYGPRQALKSESGVTAIFLTKILNNETIKIFGTGNQTRDFIFVDDVVKAHMLALDKSNNKTFNISTNSSVSINDLVKIISNIAKIKVDYTFENGIDGEIYKSVLDNAKAKKELGWTPRYSLVDGLKCLLEKS